MFISEKEYNKLSEKQKYIYDNIKSCRNNLEETIDILVDDYCSGFYQNNERDDIKRRLYICDKFLLDLLKELINEKDKR